MSRTILRRNSLYGATIALGAEPELGQLVNPQFVGSRKGSAASELKLAAKSVGLNATVYEGLGFSGLLNANAPILVLYLSPRGTTGQNTQASVKEWQWRAN